MPESSHNRPTDLGDGLRIIAADHTGRWVVVDKPSGMLSVPGKGEDKQDCVAARVRAAVARPGMEAGPLIVHRLDMDTSGLMVLGLDPEAQRGLSRQFEDRSVAKAYIALVLGTPSVESGIIDAPMRLDVGRRPYQVIDHQQGRPALTRWRLLSIETDRARLQLEPETGRTHQLRVHCAFMGHPIIGDVLYGPQPETAASGPRLMLHAARLEFDDPTDRRRVRVASPPPF